MCNRIVPTNGAEVGRKLKKREGAIPKQPTGENDTSGELHNSAYHEIIFLSKISLRVYHTLSRKPSRRKFPAFDEIPGGSGSHCKIESSCFLMMT
jgi:hypothetical protein